MTSAAMQAAADAQAAENQLPLDDYVRQLMANNPDLSAADANAIATSLRGRGTGGGAIAIEPPKPPRGAAAAAPPAGAAAAPPADDDDTVPSTRRRGGRGRGPYGEGSVSYQRAFFTQSVPGAAALGFAQAASPGGMLGQFLPAIAGPQMALIAAATALGLAFNDVTEKVKAYAAAQFVLNEQLRSRGELGTEFTEGLQGRMAGLGVGRTEETQILAQPGRYTQNQDEIQRVQMEALDFARANGLTLQQSVSMFIDAARGNAGAFNQYAPEIQQGDTTSSTCVIRSVTCTGVLPDASWRPHRAESRRCRLPGEKMALELSESVLPILEGITDAAIGMMPIVSAAIDGFVLLGSAIGDAVGFVVM